MRIHLYALLLLGTLCSLRAAPAQDSSAAAGDDSLPPVPFIIGGDDVVSPTQSGQSGPLVLPEGGKSTAAAASDQKSAPAAVSIPDKKAATDVVADKPAATNDKLAAKTTSDDLALEDPSLDLSAPTDTTIVSKPTETTPAPKSSTVANVVASTAAPAPVATAPTAVAPSSVSVTVKKPVVTATSPISSALSDDDLDSPMPLLLPSSNEVTKKSPSANPAVTTVEVATVKTPTAAPAVVAVSTPTATAVAVLPTVPAAQPTITSAPTPVVAPVATTPNTFGMTIVPVAATSTPAVSQAPVVQTVSLPTVPVAPAPPKAQTTIGADGVSQVRGVEHFVGRSNQILPPVQMSPAVAVVGEEIPELHVSQIPLEDLLAYLKDYTPLRFSYELSGPMYVSVDLKAHTVDDVMNYLMARYPVAVSTDGNTIFVRPAVARVAGQAVLPFQSRAASRNTLPVRAPDGAMTVMPAAPTGYYPYGCQAGYIPQPVSTVEESWNQVRVKARLYELEKERMNLVAEHERIQQRIHSCDIQNDAGSPSTLSELPDLVTR